jgi:2-polyprenyl-3-methyl-5-hydroxy-6-metoxy-1,4-benzoquinol methylase
MSDDLESLISDKFEELADSSMFPHDIPPDDFALKAVLEWFGDMRGRLLLDVGCARGRFVRALSGAGARVIGTDRTWKLLQDAAVSQRDQSFVLSTATLCRGHRAHSRDRPRLRRDGPDTETGSQRRHH